MNKFSTRLPTFNFGKKFLECTRLQQCNTKNNKLHAL